MSTKTKSNRRHRHRNQPKQPRPTEEIQNSYTNTEPVSNKKFCHLIKQDTDLMFDDKKHYGVADTSTDTCIKISTYTHLDVSNNETQRADKLIHNPVYNMILDTIFTALGQDLDLDGSTHLRIPNVDGKVPVLPCFPVETWLKAVKHEVGSALLIADFNKPLECIYGEKVTEICYKPRMEDSRFTEIIYSLTHNLYSNPEAIAELLIQPLRQDYVEEAEKLDQFKEFLQTLMPDQRNNHVDYKNSGLQSAILHTGSELTPVVFPEGYAIQIGGGDILEADWHFVNTKPPLHFNEWASLKTTYAVDVNMLHLQNLLVAYVEFIYQLDPDKLNPSTHGLTGITGITGVNNNDQGCESPGYNLVSSMFKKYGYQPTVEPQNYIDLNVTWASTGRDERFTIPPGRSIMYGHPTYLSASARIIMVIPHCHDHVMSMELHMENNADILVITEHIPENNAEYRAIHQSVSNYGCHGVKNNGHPMHNNLEFKSGHLPVGGLEKHVWSPGSDGPIFNDNMTTFFRTVAYFENPHCKAIDNMATTLIYWQNLTELPI